MFLEIAKTCAWATSHEKKTGTMLKFGGKYKWKKQ